MHIFLDLYRVYSVSKMVQELKSLSSLFINKKKWYQHHFEWQGGYAAFSISNTHRWNVITYIKNQQEHHKTKSFREEHIETLKKYDVPVTDEILFDDLV
jgi:REP element-mobilizing transposase RayT